MKTKHLSKTGDLRESRLKRIALFKLPLWLSTCLNSLYRLAALPVIFITGKDWFLDRRDHATRAAISTLTSESLKTTRLTRLTYGVRQKFSIPISTQRMVKYGLTCFRRNGSLRWQYWRSCLPWWPSWSNHSLGTHETKRPAWCMCMTISRTALKRSNGPESMLKA